MSYLHIYIYIFTPPFVILYGINLRQIYQSHEIPWLWLCLWFLLVSCFITSVPPTKHRENFAERPMPQEATFGPKGAYVEVIGLLC